MKPYTVERETKSKNACRQCKRGMLYMVVGPGDVAESTFFAEKEDAEDLASRMNSAYEKGVRAVRDQIRAALKEVPHA
jgi:hypothetical protein